MSSDLLALLAAILLLLANGFFVGAEFALISSRRDRLETMARTGTSGAAAVLKAGTDISRMLAAAQLGITICSLLLGRIGEPAVAHLIERPFTWLGLPDEVLAPAAFTLSLVVVVVAHMVIGEMVPKNATLSDPERTLLWTAVPARLYLKVFGPIVWALNAMSNLGVRLFGVEPRDEFTSAHTADELAVMLAESRGSGLIEAFSHDLMAGVLDFGGRNAASVMVARDDIVAFPRTATVAEIEQAVIDTGHSRIPIVDHDIDSILGFVHSKDLLTLPESAHDSQLPLGLVRRMLIVPRNRSLEELLLSMRKARVHFAVVVEDNRTTAGLVTLEDLLEELVGEILDESDHQEALERELEADLAEAAGLADLSADDLGATDPTDPTEPADAPPSADGDGVGDASEAGDARPRPTERR